MRLQKIKDLNALSDKDYINWKKKAAHSGYITSDTTLSQMNRIYQMEQLLTAGLNPNLSLDQANTALASSKLSDLLKNNQLEEEVLPLVKLYKHNPTLAAQLTDKLFSSGYLTLDEKNQKANAPLSRSGYEGGQGFNTFYKGAHDLLGKVPLVGGINEAILGGVDKLDKDIKSLDDYDTKAFKYYYDQVESERKGLKTKTGTKEEQEESIYKEARRRYLTAQNSNIFSDIQKEIDDYYQNATDAKASKIEDTLSQMSPQQIVTQLYGEGAAQKLGQLDENGREIDAFDIFADGSPETIQSAYGDITINHPGSNYWRAYKDTNVFDNFNDNQKRQVMAKYLAYKEMLGEDKANEYLETAMQTYVAQNRGWRKAIADVAGGVGTTAGLIIPEALVGVGGLAYDILGTVLGPSSWGNFCRNQASMMLTGKDLQGNEVSVQTTEEALDSYDNPIGKYTVGVLNWLGQRANLSYLNKVSQYKNWDIEEIRKADANYGVSNDAMYTIDPTKGRQFWANDALDMLDMTGQALGQIALAYLTSGASLESGAVANMGRMAATARVGAEVATVTAPIASAYAVSAANEAFNNTVQQSNEMAYREAQAQFDQLSKTEEYQRQRKEAIDKYFNQQSIQMDGKTYFSILDSNENRERQEEIYDSQQLQSIYQDIVAQRERNTNQIAQNSSLLAYRTSASLEALKYGYTTAMFGSWKLSNNANKLLEQNLGVKTYGNLTQNAAGKFTREGLHPLGIKKLTLTSPNQIAAWKTAEAAIVGGGLSNYTDDVCTGFAVGLSLGYSNSSLLREYDPKAYADTWYGDSEAAQALYIMGSGVQGANDMIKSGQPWHSFYIGVGGSFLGAGLRFKGRKDVKQQYTEQNQRYEAETGKKVSKFTKFRQGLNTYTQTLWSTYEDARMGVNRLDQNIKVYNETLDKRQDALNEVASMRQGLIQRKYADNEMSFSDAALESDNLALKLIAIQHNLESNPLRKLDKQRIDTELSELQDISEDNVSDEKREALIQSAYGAREQDKSKPLTDQRKAEIWEDIKANAKRFTDFSSDYYESISELQSRDKSLRAPDNWPLLHQKAELMAKSKRIQRDIDTLSKEVGITVDTSVTDRTQGQLTEVARNSSIKAAQETIEKLKEQREKSQEKVDELVNKPNLSEAETNELVKHKALIMRADRSVPRLEAEIEGLQEGTTIVQANSGLTTNVIQLHNMLSSPKLYTTEQQGQINRYKAQIGEKGVLYVEEMAKMQDQLNEMKDAQEALEANPETFQALVTGLQDVRAAMGEKAIYETSLQTKFNYLKTLPPEKIGQNSAISLTQEQFDRFIKENPQLQDTLNPYREMNTAFSHIYSLTQTAREAQTLDEQTQNDILRDMQSLALDDADYFVENGRQGIADMMEFLKGAYDGNQVKLNAISTLLTDFKRVAAIEKSTVAYTEHRLKKNDELAEQLADRLVDETSRQEQHEIEHVPETPDTTVESPEVVPDMASMQNETGPAMDLGLETQEQPAKQEAQEQAKSAVEAQAESEQEQLAQQEEQEAQPEAQPEQAAQPGETKLPAGVTRNSDGQVETMTAEQQAQQLGITEFKTDQLVDDSAPIVQEVTGQQEEVHGCYFNMYEGSALNAGELVPFTEGPIYEWLSKEGINLGAIIDNELNNILKANPKIQLMKVKKDGDDANVASNVFLVIEYTDKVAKHHLPENGGVIESNGKRYIIIGTMWNTKSQNGTEAANIMQATRDTLQRNGVDYFTNNPSERFYVDPVMNTEVTTFYSGHIVHTINEESRPHTIAELLDEYNRTHTAADQISISDLGFGVITMKEGLYPVGPYPRNRVHSPQRQLSPDKYGQVYVLVPAANGEIIPIFINPTLLSEIKESKLKTQIDTDIIPRLLNLNYSTREQAIIDLCQVLCISGNITNPEGKGILIGTQDIPTVSLMNGKAVIRTFDISKDDFTVEDFRRALYQLDPRINLNLSSLDTLTSPQAVLRYDEAGALTTDAAKLGTFGGKFYVAPIDPSTGQPIRVEKQSPVTPVNSDYSRAQPTGPTMLPVGGQRYVLRDGKWKHQDGSPITDTNERTQIAWAYKVYTGEAQLVDSQGSYNYYVTGIETSKPIVVVYNIEDKTYYGVPQQLADQIVAHQREVLERARAETAAAEALKEQPQADEAPQEPVTRPADETVKSETQAQEAPAQEAPKKNDFELDDTSTKEKYSIDDIMSREDMMDQADRIFDIIDAKVNSEDAATREKWKDFDMENMEAELEKRGVNTIDIEDIDSWIDNLENCK